MKFLKSLIDIDLLKNIAVFAIIYHVLFNGQIIYYLYWNNDIKAVKNIINCAYYFGYTYLWVYIIFLGIAISNIVNFWGIFFLFISSSISSYYFYIHKAFPSTHIIRDFSNETLLNMAFDDNVGLLFYLWIIFCLCVVVYSMKYFKLQSSNTYSTKLLSLICILAVVYNTVHPQNTIIYMSNPLCYLNAIFQYYWYL